MWYAANCVYCRILHYMLRAISWIQLKMPRSVYNVSSFVTPTSQSYGDGQRPFISFSAISDCLRCVRCHTTIWYQAAIIDFGKLFYFLYSVFHIDQATNGVRAYGIREIQWESMYGKSIYTALLVLHYNDRTQSKPPMTMLNVHTTSSIFPQNIVTFLTQRLSLCFRGGLRLYVYTCAL